MTAFIKNRKVSYIVGMIILSPVTFTNRLYKVGWSILDRLFFSSTKKGPIVVMIR